MGTPTSFFTSIQMDRYFSNQNLTRTFTTRLAANSLAALKVNMAKKKEAINLKINCFQHYAHMFYAMCHQYSKSLISQYVAAV